MKTVAEILDLVEAWHQAELQNPDQHGLLAEIEQAINAAIANAARSAA